MSLCTVGGDGAPQKSSFYDLAAAALAILQGTTARGCMYFEILVCFSIFIDISLGQERPAG